MMNEFERYELLHSGKNIYDVYREVFNEETPYLIGRAFIPQVVIAIKEAIKKGEKISAKKIEYIANKYTKNNKQEGVIY